MQLSNRYYPKAMVGIIKLFILIDDLESEVIWPSKYLVGLKLAIFAKLN